MHLETLKVFCDVVETKSFSVAASQNYVTQSAVSQHLAVLRENGFATVRAEGTRRVYRVATAPLTEIDAWLERFRHHWDPPLEALATEIARGKRARKR